MTRRQSVKSGRQKEAFCMETCGSVALDDDGRSTTTKGEQQRGGLGNDCDLWFL